MSWINGDLKKKQPSIQIKKEEKKHRSNVLKNKRDLQKTIRQAIWDQVKGITTQKDTEGIQGICKEIHKGQHWHCSPKNMDEAQQVRIKRFR